MCNIGTTGLIVICFAVLAGAEVHRNAAQEELRKRAQMEASLEEAVKGEKILGSAAYYALLSPQFLETNSSTEERMNVLTLMLESLTHVRVPIGQEKITIALSGNFCMDLGREYRKLNESEQGSFCPYYFDEISCWPPTQAGSYAQINCPGYIPFMTPNVTVRISCNQSGSWEYRPKTMADFCSVYGDCHIESNCNSSIRYRAKPQHSRPYQTGVDVLLSCVTFGYICSIGATAVAIAIFIYIRCIRCARNYVHLNLFIAFFLRGVFSLPVFAGIMEGHVVSASKLIDWFGCRVVVTFWQYFCVASYSWMFVEGLYLHNIIYFHVFRETNILPYFILGWGVPLVVISLWITLKTFLDNHGCWLVYEQKQALWVLTGPISVMFITNFCLFINVIRALLTKLNSANVSAAGKYRRLLKSTVILVFVFGVHYFLLIFPVQFLFDRDTMTLPMLIVLYIENIPNSLQGFIVAFTYCLYNSEVRSELKRKWDQRQQQKLGRTSNPPSTVANGSGIQSVPGTTNVSHSELERKLHHQLNLPKVRKFKKSIKVKLEFDSSNSPLRSECNTTFSTMPNSTTSTLSRKQRDTQRPEAPSGHLLPPKVFYGRNSGDVAESPIDVNRSLLAADPDDDEDDEVEETSKCPRAEDAETDL